MSKVSSLGLAEGLPFDEGRYSILSPIGSGWEAEVYSVIDSDSLPPELKAARFSQAVRNNQCYAVAPTWSQERKRFSLTSKSCTFKPSRSDRDWFNCLDDTEEDLKGKLRTELVKWQRQMELTAQATQKCNRPLVPTIENCGIVILPCNGNLLPFVFQIMPLLSYSLPALLSRTDDSQERAGEFLRGVVARICDHFRHGFLLHVDPKKGIDIHVENVMWTKDGPILIDALLDQFKPAEESAKVKDLKRTFEEIGKVAILIANWGTLGRAVLAHTQGNIFVESLDEISLLRRLLGKVPENVVKEVRKMVQDLNPKAVPPEIWD